jgi:hypothetical protein
MMVNDNLTTSKIVELSGLMKASTHNNTENTSTSNRAAQSCGHSARARI